MTAHPRQLHDFGKASPDLVSQTGMDAADESGDELIEAAAEVLDCMRVLAKSGSSLVAEALGQHEFMEWDHYPHDDVRDPESHAQYYFHAHPVSDKREADYGHFHTFLRAKGMPEGIVPAPVPPQTAKELPDEPICHLIAISMTREGLPDRLFTTNRWVTGDTWYAAPDVIKMLDRFVIDLSRPSWPLNRWLTAMLVLFRPQIVELLHERDERIAAWQTEHPNVEVYEDRRLEITSSRKTSIEEQIRSLGLLEDE